MVALRRWRRMVVLLLLLISTIAAQQSSEFVPAKGDQDEYVPAKGDQECPSLVERAQAIGTGGNSSNLWYSTCDDTVLSYNPPPAVLPPYGLTLQMYSSLPAFAPHFGTCVLS